MLAADKRTIKSLSTVISLFLLKNGNDMLAGNSLIRNKIPAPPCLGAGRLGAACLGATCLGATSESLLYEVSGLTKRFSSHRGCPLYLVNGLIFASGWLDPWTGMY